MTRTTGTVFFRIWKLNRNDQKRLARLNKYECQKSLFFVTGVSRRRRRWQGPCERRIAQTSQTPTPDDYWIDYWWLGGLVSKSVAEFWYFWALRTISCDTICLKTLKCRVWISRGFNAGTVKWRILETHIRNSDFSRTQDLVFRETLFHFEIYEHTSDKMPSCREKLIISTAVYAVFIRIDQSKCKSAALCDMTGLSIRLKVMDREITEPGRNWRCGHVACKTEPSCPNRGSLCALL